MLSVPAPAVSTEVSVVRAREKSSRCCPRCDSHSISRSRIRGWMGEAARRVLGVRPYRCLDCWHRFMGLSSRDSTI